MSDAESTVKSKTKDVAFFARTHDFISLLHGEGLKFKHVEFNYGQQYDPDTGFFICEDNALYLFRIYIANNPGEELYVYIMMDDDVKAVCYTGTGDVIGHDLGGEEAAVIRCEPGSRVWVRRDFSGPEEAMAWEVDTTFRGIKLAD